MYRLENVSKSYGDSLVLENVSFSLPPKGLVAIKGRSGSGKSTLLNLMSLMEKPTEGRMDSGSGYRQEDTGIYQQSG